ncbi:MAG: RNA 2',3'-cyclic phosphodiesterase, partial [Nitrospira sp.]|nr:RNA 2',3'-cyclic phosphodiesterase [Nitrospira sp.]
MIRAFLAIEISDEVRTAIVQVQQDIKERLAPHLSKEIRIAWGQRNSFHLTVRFLGEIEKQLIDPLREAIAKIRQSHSTIQIPLDRLQAFPNVLKPRVLWVGPSELWLQSEAAKRLVELHQEIESCCHSFGFAADEKPFSPHLTVARIKTGERQVGPLLAQSGLYECSVSLGTVTVGPVVLMKSQLRPTGPVYTKLWE